MRSVAILLSTGLALPFVGLAAQQSPSSVVFTDVTDSVGVRFRHTSGAFGQKYLPETMGGGVAIFDADGDGDQDVFFVNSAHWPGRGTARARHALYRNDGKGNLVDVTVGSGLEGEMYGQGVAAADFDNDGRVDLYVTGLGGNRLFRNTGSRFEDVTARAGVANGSFSSSAAFFDYDKDGKLDLFVCNYVDWSIQKDLKCTLDGRTKSYCTPESYKGLSSTLFHNRGDGTFEDMTRKAGLFDPKSKSLGVALLDFDSDGWLDLAVANDTQPNKLYRNNGDGTFKDVGMAAGIAFGETGVARAGMGIDAADYDGSGRQSLVISNFSNEMMSLYHNEGNGLFIDEAPTSPIGKASLLTLGFGCFFFDYDLDGRLDLFSANGHVADDIQAVQPKVTYAQPPHLFRNVNGRTFEDVSGRVGGGFARPMVARGAAYGDLDGDGDLDLIVAGNNSRPRVLRNDGGSRNRVLRVRLVGARSNRDGIGARVTVTPAASFPRTGMVRTGSSYCSQSETVLTFGLGDATGVSRVDVVWPSGAVEKIEGIASDRTVTIREGQGVVATVPIRQAG